MWSICHICLYLHTFRVTSHCNALRFYINVLWPWERSCRRLSLLRHQFVAVLGTNAAPLSKYQGKSNDRQRGRRNPLLEVSQSRNLLSTERFHYGKKKLLTTSPLLSAQLLDLQLPQMSAERPQENPRNHTMHMYCCDRTLL